MPSNLLHTTQIKNLGNAVSTVTGLWLEMQFLSSLLCNSSLQSIASVEKKIPHNKDVLHTWFKDEQILTDRIVKYISRDFIISTCTVRHKGVNVVINLLCCWRLEFCIWTGVVKCIQPILHWSVSIIINPILLLWTHFAKTQSENIHYMHWQQSVYWQ